MKSDLSISFIMFNFSFFCKGIFRLKVAFKWNCLEECPVDWMQFLIEAFHWFEEIFAVSFNWFLVLIESNSWLVNFEASALFKLSSNPISYHFYHSISLLWFIFFSSLIISIKLKNSLPVNISINFFPSHIVRFPDFVIKILLENVFVSFFISKLLDGRVSDGFFCDSWIKWRKILWFFVFLQVFWRRFDDFFIFQEFSQIFLTKIYQKLI